MRNICPNCGGKLERTPGMYAWKGVFMHGWVCPPCGSLVDVRGAFINYVRKISGDTKAERERRVS